MSEPSFAFVSFEDSEELLSNEAKIIILKSVFKFVFKKIHYFASRSQKKSKTCESTNKKCTIV